ncbi:MAG: OB-fold domain-containing protein [Acidimicrobiales bacterium]|nr:OB-fold domain-containing protein [Acidimicrobiales bacterium]
MARVSMAPDYFEIDDDGVQLKGSKCDACAEVFYPRRLVCAKCLNEGTTDVMLSTTGTLHTWTWVKVPLFAKTDATVSAYAVGQVDLPEGPRIQAILQGDQDAFTIGMHLTLDTETLRQTEEGDDVVIYRFTPVAS